MARNIRRLLRSQSAEAVRQLESFHIDPEYSVHEARIIFKRIRTLLHLLRRALGKKNFRYFNHAFRDLGIKLSGQRDQWAKLQAINELKSGPTESSQKMAYTVTPEDVKSVEEVLLHLCSLREELNELKIEPKGFKLVKACALEICRDGEASMCLARDTDTDTDEAFHEWRKNAKHLYHFVAILQPINKRELVPLRDEFYTLTQLLGDYHDLTLLKLDTASKHDDELQDKIVSAQRAIRSKALVTGAKLYRASAKEFIEYLRIHWKAFRSSRP